MRLASVSVCVCARAYSIAVSPNLNSVQFRVVQPPRVSRTVSTNELFIRAHFAGRTLIRDVMGAAMTGEVAGFMGKHRARLRTPIAGTASNLNIRRTDQSRLLGAGCAACG